MRPMICTPGRALARFLWSLLSVVLVAGVSLAARLTQRGEPAIRIAAAADLKFAMDELARDYETRNHVRVDVTYGSSGNLFSQIQNGAPFDLFFSADTEYPQRAEAAGLAEPQTLFTYAIGQIVLWAPPNAKVNLAKQGWDALLDASVQKIAIANPEHAPYGRAAVAALQKTGIYEQVRPKLVYGENISQAAQFVQSGNAQLGVVAKSLAMSPAMASGQMWEIPANMYPPIEQAALILKSATNKSEARTFLEFVRSAHGRAILQQHGFAAPGSSTAQ